MKYVTIMAKTPEYRVNDRIVVQVNEDCFLATVTSVRQGQIYLKFDDGDTGKVSINSKRVLGRGINRTVKKAFTKKEAVKYIINSNKLVSTKINNIPNINQYNNKKQYLLDLWKYFNKKYFQNKLLEPKFIITKDSLVEGEYIPSIKAKINGIRFLDVDKGGTIKLVISLFKNENLLREALLHEMCHQAVVNIDKTKITVEKPHGETWKKYAIKCKIPLTYGDSKQKLTIKNEGIRYSKIRTGDYCLATSTDSSVVYPCVVVYRDSQNPDGPIYILYEDYETGKSRLGTIAKFTSIYNIGSSDEKELKKRISQKCIENMRNLLLDWINNGDEFYFSDWLEKKKLSFLIEISDSITL